MALRVPLTLCLFLVTSSADANDPCSKIGALYKIDNDCHKFRVCQNDFSLDPVPQTCPQGFDCFKAGHCIVETSANECTNPCGTTPTKRNKCKRDCITAGLGPIFDWRDCSKFYYCVLGIPVEQDCDTEYFIGDHCDSDRTQCCNCQTPVCDGTYEELPDPKNCKRKYSCLEITGAGKFHLIGPTDCPDGEFFDTNHDVMRCAPIPSGYECTPTCNLGVDITTTTAVTPVDECWDLDDFSCPDSAVSKYYPLCPTSCDKRWIGCSSTGIKEEGECWDGDVFPIDGSQVCVHPEDCVAPFYIHI